MSRQSGKQDGGDDLTVADLLADLDAYDDSWQGVANKLRVDLAELVIRGLRARGWTQKALSDESGLRESVISQIIHSRKNVTIKTISKLMHALQMRIEMAEQQDAGFDSPFAFDVYASQPEPLFPDPGITDDDDAEYRLRSDDAAGWLQFPAGRVEATEHCQHATHR